MTILFVLLTALLQYADPMVGTDAHGHTFPGAVYPFGMVQLSPDTRPRSGDWDGCSGYHYSDSVIYGFSHTHLSGTGCDDWCDILVTPGEGPSRFSHSREKASPGYYEVYLDDARVLARMTAGRRCGVHEYTFEKNVTPRLTINLQHRDYLDEGILHTGPDWCSGKRVSSSWARHQTVYFYMEFSAPGEASVEGSRAVFTFKDRIITVRAAISSVSEEAAKANLYAEYPTSFQAVRKDTEKAWKQYLGKLKCPYKDKEHRRRFYTALYHTGIHPSLYSDADGRYRGMDGQIHRTEGWDRYTVFSTWDTFRGEHPLLCIIEPERTVDFIKTMISVYEENGKLPVWELSGYETDCMIGYNSVPVIADAIARGITGFDVEKAYEAMKASSWRPEHGMESFRKNGFVLADDEHESVSKTLEFAYDDWCVAQVAKFLGRTVEYTYYMRCSEAWRNVFDSSTGFMRARLNGRWYTPFDPREVNNNYTEANAWQYSFFVPHDIPGLIDALGGPEAFEQKLDALFDGPEGNTGRTQADITGCIGQYAHGNEPSHHIPFLYNAIGKPEKAASRVQQILETLYTSAPDGLCGNDDCGQMSAWYVLSSLGLYPVCPGKISASESGAPAEDGITKDRRRLVTSPVFRIENDIFADSLQVSLEGEGILWYRVNGGSFNPYFGPFVVRKTSTLEAFARTDAGMSVYTRSRVYRIHTDRDISVLSRVSKAYTAGGPEALIDDRRGGLNWRTGGWQGYQGVDFEAVIDLREVRDICLLGAGFCQDARSWIWMPSKVIFEASADGETWSGACSATTPAALDDMTVQIWNYECPVSLRARYIRLKALNPGPIPDWHPGAGSPSFIFIDEIRVE